jgi:hypothetical protein
MLKRLLLAVIAITLLSLAGCVQILSDELTIEMARENNWNVTEKIVVPASSAAIVENALNSGELAPSTVDYSWERLDRDQQGNIPYQVKIKAVTYAQLNDLYFNGSAFSISEDDRSRRIVHFEREPDWQYKGSGSYTLTLKGSQVISSNGEVIGAGSVRWTDPQVKMVADMVEGKPGLAWQFVLMIAGAVLILIAVVLYFARQTSRPAYPPQGLVPQPVYPVAAAAIQPAAGILPVAAAIQPAAEVLPEAAGIQPEAADILPVAAAIQPAEKAFCPQCGTAFPAGAGFCPKCGAKR